MDPLNPQALPEALNLCEVFLHRQLPEHGSRVALRTEKGQWTYRKLAEFVDRATAVYRGLGLVQEQRVLLALPDVPEFAVAWFAAVKAGGVVAAISPEPNADTLRYYLNYTRARILVAHGSLVQTLQSIRHECPFLQHVLTVESAGQGPFLSFEHEVERASPDERFASTHRDDPAVWLFTSGSTGFPKAAVHKQHDFVYGALTFGLPILGYSPGDICLSVPKLAFGYALGTNLLFPLLAGASAVLFPEKSAPDRLFELIGKFKPTFLTGVPTAFNAMVNSPAVGDVDFSSLRVSVSAGEALPAELYEKWKARTGVEILDGIGSAEMFHIFITNRVGDVKVGSLGKIVAGYEAKICDDEGHSLPPGEIGTLWIRGDSMALEYWQKHEESKRTFRGDWCVSADKFSQDADGYFYFTGRGDDLLKVNGKFLSPLEVENVLLAHPAVKEAAVVGFKDADGLEKPKAFIVLQDAKAASDALAEELKAFVRERLTPYKAPRLVQFTDGLPKSDRGKVLRSQLRG
jgi:benzoate-CoA ligase family protein